MYTIVYFTKCIRSFTFFNVYDRLHMKVNTPRDIGALIKEHRNALKLNQQELAERIGVTRVWLQRLEQGKPTAQVGLVLRTLKTLGLTINITAGTETSRPPATVDLAKIISDSIKKP
jgi:HTH-type transcriptional regulator/antitoxin HipB